MADVILKPGREKSVLRYHPWIFSGAISKIIGEVKPGETVDIRSAQGEFVARGAINPHSNISCRVWTWDEGERVDQDLFDKRLSVAINSRNELMELIKSTAVRIVHGESDNLPGLILDRYGDIYCVQFLTAGVEYFKQEITESIKKLTGTKCIYERSDVDVRSLEGLPAIKGNLVGSLPDKNVIIEENDLEYYVDIITGHKTGFYLDQRENRSIARRIAGGLYVLDCFSYTGAFGINTLAGGAKYVSFLDSSQAALEVARGNVKLNQLDENKVCYIEQDVFKYLRILRDRREVFDLIILDPPKFAPTVSQSEKAARGYKDINLMALKIIKPGGYLMTFSCSGGVSEELFQKIVSGAAQDAKANVVILKRLHQAIDHPVALNFPEGAYLKGFLLQKRN